MFTEYYFVLINISVIDAGIRIPRGILQGNLVDLGNYHQCLGINKQKDDMVIEGKYCQIKIGLSQLENLGGNNEWENINESIDSIKDKIHLYKRIRKNLEVLDGVDRKPTLG